MGVRPPMGSVGDRHDNAMADGFFASLELELTERRTRRTKSEAKLALFRWIEGRYDPRHRQRGLGQLASLVYER